MARRGAADVYFEVDDRALVSAMRHDVNKLERLVELVAMDLSGNLEEEGGAVQSALGGHWNVDRGPGQFAARVQAPEDAWWAHFIAHGTRDHGPRSADRLVFAVDGQVVSADRVRGVTANPFDERAKMHTRSKIPTIIRRMLG